MRRFLAVRRHRAAETIRREGYLLQWLRPHLVGMPLAAITYSTLDELRLRKLEEGSGPRTANYVAGLVSTVLQASVECGWITAAPRVRPLKLPPGRVRWLSHAECADLLAVLTQPLRDMAEFTLETGLRWGNVSGLRWSNVDLHSALVTFSAREMKGATGLSIPLSERALRIVESRRRHHAQWVFTSQGKRVQRPPRHSWYGALERAGISDFRWHDLRHTWASWHAQRGTPLLVLQQLGGWKSASMVARYAHLDVRSMREHVAGLSAWRASAAQIQGCLDF